MIAKTFNLLSSVLLLLIPKKSQYLNSLFKRYVDRFNGDNNDNMSTNGELDYLEEVLASSKVVFDVGANNGSWTAQVIMINPTAIVHCFEPSRATFQQLVDRNFPDNVICNNCGLGSKNDERLLYVFEEGSGNNSLYQRRGLEAGWNLRPQQLTETIHLLTLDHYCQQHHVTNIDLLKIDVEGHELEVLHGGTTLLQQGIISLIQFEYGGSNIDSGVLLKHIFEFLTPFGYKFYKIFPHSLRYYQDYDQRLENFQYQNWVASLKDL